MCEVTSLLSIRLQRAEGHKLLQLVTPTMLTNVWIEPTYSYSMCLATHNALTKHM